MIGEVITFYSYKGGVGRSFTLANTALLLARWGKRVLCVDWDLEAPGLTDYFRPLLAEEPVGGVVDLVDDFEKDPAGPLVERRVRLDGVGTLDFIAAGLQDDRYVEKVQSLEWGVLYEKGFGDYLERCREQWTLEYDYVLLDSRTGVSDIGCICTAHLPDRLVVLFTANEQSIKGAADVARRADVARDGMPYDRSRLTVMPVLTRFDTRDEYAMADNWRQRCVDETRDLLRTWMHPGLGAEALAKHLSTPYVSHWTFGEQLPVQRETDPTSDQISYSLETLASIIARGFDRTELLVENRDSYVNTVKDYGESFQYDIWVSSRRESREVAEQMVVEFGEVGLTAKLSLSGQRADLGRAAVQAKHLCLLVEGELSRWQVADAELFLHKTMGADRRIVPVLTAGTDVNSLPGYLANLRFVKFGPSGRLEDTARLVADHLAGGARLVQVEDADVVGELLQASSARLRPRLWDVVDDILQALNTAVSSGDDVWAGELAADLAVTTRPRLAAHASAYHVPVPMKTKEAIDYVVSLLKTRFTPMAASHARARAFPRD